MERSEILTDLTTALAKAQGEIKSAAKDSTNPHFRSKYADLAAVVDAYREPFARHGLALTQHPSVTEAGVAVTSMLTHASGQWISSTLTMPLAQATPQAVGSAITYARRYSAMAIAGIASEDDDAEAATAPYRGGPSSTPNVKATAWTPPAGTKARGE